LHIYFFLEECLGTILSNFFETAMEMVDEARKACGDNWIDANTSGMPQPPPTEGVATLPAQGATVVGTPKVTEKDNGDGTKTTTTETTYSDGTKTTSSVTRDDEGNVVENHDVAEKTDSDGTKHREVSGQRRNGKSYSASSKTPKDGPTIVSRAVRNADGTTDEQRSGRFIITNGKIYKQRGGRFKEWSPKNTWDCLDETCGGCRDVGSVINEFVDVCNKAGASSPQCGAFKRAFGCC